MAEHMVQINRKRMGILTAGLAFASALTAVTLGIFWLHKGGQWLPCAGIMLIVAPILGWMGGWMACWSTEVIGKIPQVCAEEEL